ncbi:MAG TPA: glycoside hydrolase family 2 TIM barrel-domain containing protein [Bacteroidales bacterium]|nr:glycoside hydrolase family 2 TIM barrel-domain containing protein [Bacteroidales bacterium]
MKLYSISSGLFLGLIILLNSCTPGNNSIQNEFPVYVKTNPLFIVDLASDTAWSLTIDDSISRPIKVPGGGYNSDMQDLPQITHPPVNTGIYKSEDYSKRISAGWLWLHSGHSAVKDHVEYRRKITIPQISDQQSVVIEFGAVNHGAEVFLADEDSVMLIATHTGPMMPFTADLSDKAEGGKTYTLIVRSYPIWHYKEAVPSGFTDFVPIHPGWYGSGWDSKFAYGITKYIHLGVYPRLRIRDVFIRTSVAQAQISCDLWIENNSNSERSINVDSQFSSWNKENWIYPEIPAQTIKIPAKSELKIVLGPVAWKLGPESYWWPNKPFSENYRAQLHYLNIRISENGREVHSRNQRFGFVEWSEGPFYYLVNGVRINFISDGTPESAMSDYDCYSVSPAFLKPTKLSAGCTETWKKYMRLGICANRIHQSTPTEYMMDVADELGFMLIPETGLRGFSDPLVFSRYLTQSVTELAQVCRNHPSVCRYSLANESVPQWTGDLADAIVQADDSRPLVFEDNKFRKPGRITGKNGSHAYCMLHYMNYPKPAQMITGMGEFAWDWNLHEPFPVADGGIEEFIYYGGDMRLNDIAYFAGWCLINYWPNFLEGMNYERNIWKQSTHPDRRDGIDGWNSPVIEHLQQVFHPYLVMDTAFYKDNGVFTGKWPDRIPSYTSGEPIKRTIAIFNDALTGSELSVRWSLKWDSPDGELISQGTIDTLKIHPGFHIYKTVETSAPQTTSPRTVFLVLENLRGNEKVFADKQVKFTIEPSDDL